MKKKLSQFETNKLKILTKKQQKLETELAEYMENYVLPIQAKIEELRKEIDRIELE